MKLDRAWRWLSALALLACAMRFVALETSPPGFYLDEAAVSAQIICVRQTGADAYGEKLPVFSNVLGGGFANLPYLYGGVAWTSVFGDSIASFRAFAASLSVLMLLGLACLSMALFKDWRVAVLAALAGAISPWGFQFARISWDPIAGPCFLVWACAVYAAAKSWRGGLVAGVLLALAGYSYPPIRLSAVLIAIPLLAWKKSGDRSWRAWSIEAAVSLAAFVAAWPLVKGVLDASVLQRFELLSIFSPSYLATRPAESALEILLKNIAVHFRPSYLFTSGDANLRHGTGAFGILGALDILALIASPVALFFSGLRYREKLAIAFAAFGFFAGLVSAAMTWESLPHALRSIGGLPFLSIFTGAILAVVSRKLSATAPILGAISIIAFGALLYVQFRIYPDRARAWFEADLNEGIKRLRSSEDWARFMSAPGGPQPLVRQYYWMTDGKQDCIPDGSPSRRAW